MNGEQVVILSLLSVIRPQPIRRMQYAFLRSNSRWIRTPPMVSDRPNLMRM